MAHDVAMARATGLRRARPVAGRARPPVAAPRRLPIERAAGNDVAAQLPPASHTPTIMRKGSTSTVDICRRVLETRKFTVTNGGVRVLLRPDPVDHGVPGCTDFEYGVTLTRSEDWWPDDDIATCEATTGGTGSFSFAHVPAGTYYLTVWRTFDHPHCCLTGDVQVLDEAVAGDSAGCRRDTDLSAMDIVHGALDVAGFIPVLGAIPDGVNAAIYVVEGDWASAGLSAVAMVPAWGDGVKLGTIAGKTVVRVSEKAAFRLGEEGIAAGLKEVRLASRGGARAAEEVVEAEAKAAKGAAKGAARAEKEAAEEATEQAAKRGEKEAGEQATKKAEKEAAEPPTKSSRCSDAVVALLHAAVKRACRNYSCTMQGDTCATATAKVAAGHACIAAREKMQKDCWRPGDPGFEGHMQQIGDSYAARRRCEQVMMEKCT